MRSARTRRLQYLAWTFVSLCILWPQWLSAKAGSTITFPKDPFVWGVERHQGQFYFYVDEAEAYPEKAFQKKFQPIFQAPLYNTLIYVPDDKSLSHEFLKAFGTKFAHPRMFITRNVQRAIRNLGDSKWFFSQPKRPLSLIEEAGAVDEYKKALTFLKSKTPRANFVMLLAHHSTQFETRLQELIQQDVFKGQHVIARVCNGPTTCLPKLSKMLLESGDHAALSVTYTADRAVAIPFACLEMYYVVTHPDLFQPPSESSDVVSTPLELSTHINSELEMFIQKHPHREEFENELLQWWSNSVGKQYKKTPEEIRNLIRQLYNDRKDIERTIQKKLSPVQEVVIPTPAALSVRYALERDQLNAVSTP